MRLLSRVLPSGFDNLRMVLPYLPMLTGAGHLKLYHIAAVPALTNIANPYPALSAAESVDSYFEVFFVFSVT